MHLAIGRAARIRRLGGCFLGLGAFGLLLQSPVKAEVIQFSSSLDGNQSIAINSTALATRTGTGSGSVTFDTDTGDISLTLSFSGLIATDITTGTPGINPDGTMTPMGTVSGNDLPGAGILLAHFHVGAPGVNGPIPIDLFTQMGPAPGVVADFASGATAGSLSASFNLFDLAGDDGVLLNNVLLQGDGNGCASNPPSPTCGFIDALLQGQTYFNIHTFNNPFGEIRGQINRVAVAPEPASLSLLGLALAGAALAARSARRRERYEPRS